MKASALALALSCLLSQMNVTASCAERYVSETHSSAATMAYNAGLPPVSFADMRRSRALSNEACALLSSAQYEEAESKLRTALSLEPGLASAHCNLGLLLNKTGRAQEAISHLEYAHQMQPTEPAPLVTLAAAHQLCGNLSRAAELYNVYMGQFPAAPDRAVIADIVKHLQMESSKMLSASHTANYHWDKSCLKVYVHGAAGVDGFKASFNDSLRDAFLSWSQSGALSFEFVDDLSQADIECVWTDDVSKLSSIGEGGEAVLKHRGPVVTHAKITLLTKRVVNNSALSEREVKSLCLHEIGHALGVMEHSPRPNDVMYFTLTAAANPTANDFNTLSSLYRAN